MASCAYASGCEPVFTSKVLKRLPLDCAPAAAVAGAVTSRRSMPLIWPFLRSRQPASALSRTTLDYCRINSRDYTVDLTTKILMYHRLRLVNSQHAVAGRAKPARTHSKHADGS